MFTKQGFNEFERGIQLFRTQTKDIPVAAEVRFNGKGLAIEHEDVPALHELCRRYMETNLMVSFEQQERERAEREAHQQLVSETFTELTDSEKAALKVIYTQDVPQKEIKLFDKSDIGSLIDKKLVTTVEPNAPCLNDHRLLVKDPEPYVLTELGIDVAELLSTYPTKPKEDE